MAISRRRRNPRQARAAHRRRHPLGRTRAREAAARLKDALIEDGLWSQYLEVAIGPDAEIFTKTAAARQRRLGRRDRRPLRFQLEQPRAGSRAGREQPRRHPRRDARQRRQPARLRGPQRAAARARPRTTTRPARSARSSGCSTSSFTLDDVRSAVVELEIVGDGRLPAERPEPDERDQPRSAQSSCARRSSEHHYPDGFALFLGTLFAPTQDRDEPGRGFTHKIGDVVRISTPSTRHAGEQRDDVATMRRRGRSASRALMRNLASRGLLISGDGGMPVTDTLTHLHRWRGGRRRRRGREPQPVRTSTTSSRAIPRAAPPK